MPSALDRWDEISQRLRDKVPAVFLDYDGTLTPIVERPELAVLSKEMRQALRQLSETCPTAVISGRSLDEVREMVGLPGLYYAGSHGFDISGPQPEGLEHHVAAEKRQAIQEATARLRLALDGVPGVEVEPKSAAVAVHYRRAAAADVPTVLSTVERVASEVAGLAPSSGKKVAELSLADEWDKGKAVAWLLAAWRNKAQQLVPVYIGDDVTDEDAFRSLERTGITIFVGNPKTPSAAQLALENSNEVLELIQHLIDLRKRQG